MALPWIKLYIDILDDPKIYKLRVPLRWRFIECLLMANREGYDGELPSPDIFAWYLRDDQEKVETDFIELAEAGLLNQTDSQWSVTKFAERQKPLSAAERQRRYYAKKQKERRQKEYQKKQTSQFKSEPLITNSAKPTEDPTANKLLPFHLQTPEFMNEWGEWTQHHLDMNRPLTAGAVKEQVKMFNDLGEKKSIAAMQHSRKNNYIGLVVKPEESNEQRYSKHGTRNSTEHGIAPEADIEYEPIELPPDHPANREFPE